MSDITEFKPLDKEEEKTMQMLKEKGMTFKGVSKAFSMFLILWFLSKRDMHGYMIMKKIDEFFKPQIEHGLMNPTKANKIYPLLKSMNESKLIESYNGIHNKKEVKKYRLTPEGEKMYSFIKKDYKLNITRGMWRQLINDFDLQLLE